MNLAIIYTALSVFGLGVTVIDFLGILSHGDEDSGGGGHTGEADGAPAGSLDDDGGSDSGDDGGSSGDDGGGSGDGGDAGDTDGGGDNSGSDDGDTDGGGGDSGSSGDDGDDRGNDTGGGHDGQSGQSGHNAHDHASYLSPGSSGVKAVTAVMGLLRTAVYFSFGAGPTGLFALFRGLSRGQSLLWAAGVGTGTALLARLLRKFIRRDLDSSIKPEEFLMEKAVLLLPLEPGTIAKAVVRQYGTETEIYVKCRDPQVSMKKGTELRIIDFDNELYWVEAVNEKE